ncbi:hypothetical protein RDWZM_003391 [Blomia tropicalis]|uniref:Uncharacterized protein n=1 Tax=Blomia tropicalis TaxID=40697 RepID=A0A9Q0RT00_BLOTA|nr:hypothetical protein RDWZM_003391 [Blomia tropicalis]
MSRDGKLVIRSLGYWAAWIMFARHFVSGDGEPSKPSNPPPGKGPSKTDKNQKSSAKAPAPSKPAKAPATSTSSSAISNIVPSTSMTYAPSVMDKVDNVFSSVYDAFANLFGTGVEAEQNNWPRSTGLHEWNEGNKQVN